MAWLGKTSRERRGVVVEKQETEEEGGNAAARVHSPAGHPCGPLGLGSHQDLQVALWNAC